MKIKFFFTLLCVISCYVFAQQDDNSNILNTDGSGHDDETVFIINSFNYNLDGRTKVFAIVKKADLKIGEEITGHSNLEKYIQNKKQLLANERVLESSNIEYELEDARNDGKIPVNITVTAVDTWNVIAIPHPKYDSNTGFSLTLKGRDYNFLGTMEPVRLDLGYRNDEHNRTFFNFKIDSNTPFELFNLNWTFKFNNFYEYRSDMEKQHFLDNTTGISVNLPVWHTTLTIGFNESFILNKENSINDIYLYNIDQFQEGLYMSSSPFISWEIPTGLEIYTWDKLTYTPQISANFNHEISSPLDPIRIGPFLNLSHNLGFGRIDWFGNFLKGLQVDIKNSFTYDFYHLNSEPWDGNINFTLIAHNAIDDLLGLSTRIMYRHSFFDKQIEDAGDALRGIIDNSIGKDSKGVNGVDYMISLNFNITAKIITFKPSEIFNKKSLRLMNFDIHFSPFIDTAVYRSPYNETEFGYAHFAYKNFLMTGGLDVLVFPEFFKSLCLRASLGLNLFNRPNRSRTEFYIGTELYY